MTAAYLVVLAVVLLYVILYAFKLARLQRLVAELACHRREQGETADDRASAE